MDNREILRSKIIELIKPDDVGVLDGFGEDVSRQQMLFDFLGNPAKIEINTAA